MEKLDTFSKILLATQTINFIASNVNAVNLQLSAIPNGDVSVHIDPIKENNNKVLDNALEKLKGIMEELGDYINATDCISPIDVRITKQAFLILLHGKDDVEK